MTSQTFRRLALAFPETSEGAHMGHPDFRVRGEIFATLRYPAEGWGMVKLTPEDQQVFVGADPATFTPVKGAWGLRGATTVRLKVARSSTLRSALLAAWRTAAPKNLAEQFGTLRRKGSK